ncbi:hypothetical protein V1290_002861 [Bradyrhizobium sp. AZCC 1578]|uniref:hypothetical protein n=1 Tax=Bradyrhizobium sp. AZCC 1578 TaxID=3117027 RepID=UPI002FEEED92
MKGNDFYEALTPFVSLTLGRPKPAFKEAALAKAAIDGVKALLASAVSEKIVRDIVEASSMVDPRSGAAVSSFRYKRHTSPGWTSDARIVDVENHLAVAIALNGLVALHFSDARLRGSVRLNLIADVHKDLPLSWLFAVPRGIMSAAFLQDGEARTMWLSGTHRRNALKADTKILSGLDLDYALDPFDDQSFFWSAARSRNAKLNAIIGVSPGSSRVWTRKTASFDDFVSVTASVLVQLRTAKNPLDTPFRYLASPLTTIDPKEVHSAFDVSLVPDELSPEREDDESESSASSAFVYETNLVIDQGQPSSPSFSMEAKRNGQSLGTLSVEVKLDPAGKVRFAVKSIKTDQPELLDAIAHHIVAGERVNVRYDSGHSISAGHVFTLRNRRVPFHGFEGRDFSHFDISKEKPSSLDRIGKEDSLFCWVQRNFGGWLACDDGSMEKADFIHLDNRAKPNVLSLIHVKGANSTAARRGISVSAYEVVTGQAVKNLLWLDQKRLAEGLASSVRASNYFWRDKKGINKRDFVRQLDGVGSNYETRVIVLQPHVSAARHLNSSSGAAAQRLRMDQLNVLLASAERTCGALGAKFSVICDV